MTDMISVSSSNIESVGYEEETQEVYVKFLNGSTYKYLGVPINVYNALLTAPSVGQYLNKNIKPLYNFERV